MSTEWEMIETLWTEERENMQGEKSPKTEKHLNNKLGTQLNTFDAFLQSARKRLQKDPYATNLVQETKVIQLIRLINLFFQNQQESLRKLAIEIRRNSSKSPLAIKADQLERAYDSFIVQLESGDQVSNQLEEFLQNADSILNQLEQMKQDLQTSTAAVAGELGPLAKQKASSVIADGERLLKHGQSANNQQKVTEKLEKLRRKIDEIDQLARQRIEGNSRLFEQVQALSKWLKEHAEPFLANNGNLGADNSTAQDFVQTHWNFATDLIVSLFIWHMRYMKGNMFLDSFLFKDNRNLQKN
jgi:hypothetical protein